LRPLKIKIPSKKSRQAALRGGINSGVNGLNIGLFTAIDEEAYGLVDYVAV
jgi:hypothetical protein